VKCISEDEIDQIEKARKGLEEANIEFRGMMKMIRLHKLDETQEMVVNVLERMMEGFIVIGYHLCDIDIKQVYLSRNIDNFQREIKQLRETLDTFQQNK